MRRIVTAACALALAGGLMLTGCAGTGGNAKSDAADMVVYGSIYTNNDPVGVVDAMAVKDGKIAYLGDKAGAEKLVADGTDVQDFGDQFITPGFVDGHCHVYIAAENSVCDFNVVDCKNAKECVDMITKYVKENPKDFYIGYGWLDVMFENGQPTADLLDAIPTDSPIYLKSEDCHSAWTNTAMTKKCGITKDTKDPDGGVIERDAQGNPAGCYRDTAMDVLVKPFVPVYSVDEYKDMLLKAQDEKMKLGYTAYNDVFIDETSMDNIVEAYRQLDEEGKLTAYVNAACIVNNNDKALDMVDHIKELADGVKGDHFKLTDVKLFMDGITESCTCYMKEPYLNNKENYGVDRWSGKESTQRLNEVAKKCNDLGLVAHFHAIGDAAVTKALDAIQYAKENSSNKDVRNVITHAEFINPDDYQRFADLGVVLSADLGWGYAESPEMMNDPTYKNIEITNLGADRVNSETPYASVMKTGAYVAFATDAPATPVAEPLKALQIGVNRDYDGIKGTGCNPDQKITVQEGLNALTAGGAYQLGHEEDFGVLAEGMMANFIVMDDDLTKIDPEKIGQVKVTNVFVDGK